MSPALTSGGTGTIGTGSGSGIGGAGGIVIGGGPGGGPGTLVNPTVLATPDTERERNAEVYGMALAKLMPPGQALTVKPGGKLEQLLKAMGLELWDIVVRTVRLLEEGDPRQATELLPEWEGMVGLPNACMGEILSTGERRAATVSLLVARGGANPRLIESMAEELGFFGAQVVEYEPLHADNFFAESLAYGPDWAYVWDLIAPEVNPIFFRCGASACGEPLTESANQILECLAKTMAPAHTLGRAMFTLPPSGEYQPWDPAEFRVPTLVLQLLTLAPSIEES